MTQPEQRPTPSIDFSAIDIQNRAVVEILDEGIRQNPELYEVGLGIADAIARGLADVAFATTLDYWEKHNTSGDALRGAVDTWRHVLEKKLDTTIEFDPATEQQIADDPNIQELINKFKTSRNNEHLRDRIRVARLRKYIGAVAAGSSKVIALKPAREKAGQVASPADAPQAG